MAVLSSRKSWQALQSKVKSRLAYIYEHEQFADVRFVVGKDKKKTEIRGHKLILASSSKVFESVFFNEKGKGEGQIEFPSVIEVDDIDPEAFTTLLDYVYTDEVNLTSIPVSIGTAYAAKKYELWDLYKTCVAHLGRQLSIANGCEIYEGSVTLLGDSDLAVKAITFIANNAPAVLASEGFLSCSLVTAIKIVRDVAPLVDNKILFLALIAWAMHYCGDQETEIDSPAIRNILEPFLPHVLFLSLSSADFIQTVGESGVLTDEEVCSVAINIERPGSRPLPSWCAVLKPGGELRCVLPLTVWSASSPKVSLSCRFTIGGVPARITGFETFLVLVNEGQDSTVDGTQPEVVGRLNAKLYFENETKQLVKEYKVDTEMPDTIMRYYLPTPELLKVGEAYRIRLEVIEGAQAYRYHCGSYQRKVAKVPFMGTSLVSFNEEETVHGLIHALVFLNDSHNRPVDKPSPLLLPIK